MYPFCLWLAVTMEYFADAFECLGYVEHGAMLYLNTMPIPAELLAEPLWELPLERKLELVERTIARLVGPARGVVACAKAVAAVKAQELALARSILDDVEARKGWNWEVRQGRRRGTER